MTNTTKPRFLEVPYISLHQRHTKMHANSNHISIKSLNQVDMQRTIFAD